MAHERFGIFTVKSAYKLGGHIGPSRKAVAHMQMVLDLCIMNSG
jgi:hypothetical protein